jgi:hypothetical protein
VRPTGPKHRQRFLCELRVPGFDYVAAGNSTVKKDAQSKAARDFVAFLVGQGLMQARFVLLLLRLFVPGSQFPEVFRIQIVSRVSGGPWIRIRIRNPDVGGQKLRLKIEKR